MTFIACAAMLTSAIALNSCKNEEPQGNYEGTAEVVKTEFAISIPGSSIGGPNRMPGTTVQRNVGEFQEMTGIFLVPFAVKSVAPAKPVATTSSRLDHNIHLSGNVAAADVATTGKAKVYSDVAIPLTTASFLFYGKSGKTGTKFETGSLVVVDTNATTPASFQFQLDPVLTDANATALGTKQTALLNYLTSIAKADDGKGTPHTWYEYPDAYADSAAFNAMFAEFITMHGISTFEIERVLTDLNKSLKPRYSTSPLAKAIIDSIAAPSWASIDGTDTVRLASPYNNFPEEYLLPQGSVDITWDDGNNKFVAGDYTNMSPLAKYVYPAQLWYFANSNIKTHNSSLKSLYDAGDKYWSQILAAYEGPDAVNTLTRSVAIVDTVQYAVARLDVQVRLKDSVDFYMEDNSKTVEGIRKDVNCSAGIPVTGIFIGGQNHVGYNFVPAAAGDFTIYDNVMTSTAEGVPAPMLAEMHTSAGAYSAMNHTLVLESMASTNVRIAVEMKNTTGVDFYGQGGKLIPKNGKFYVIAELAAASATETDSKVFKQDYKTTAKLTLKSLKNAYNTIPDLRTPQLEIGFAVDLTWQSGHEYEINIE